MALAALGALAVSDPGHGLRAGRAIFLLLFAIEALLLDASLSARPRIARRARTAMFVVPLAAALGLRAYQALATPDLLDWDETYYLSAAVTAARGHGLYPYVFGYGPMQILGGFGYAVYAYAFAVQLAGPTLLALRAVSLAASVLGLAGIWLLLRTWYGSGAAWIGAALVSSIRLFVLSNTARMDAAVFAYVAWALVMVAFALQRWDERRPHLVAGLIFGLGLQVHIDTVVTAIACGVLYLIAWARRTMQAERFAAPVQPLLYLAGWLAGLLLFVCVNILPNASAFYATTALMRLDATSWYSRGTPSVFGSFLDPRILVSKEAARYLLLARVVPVFEIVLVAAAFAAMYLRRASADRLVMVLVPAVPVAAAVVLNNAAPTYFIHVLPALVVPLGPLFTHGVTRQPPASASEIGPRSLFAFIVVIAALGAVNQGSLVRALARTPGDDSSARELARRVRSVAETRCKVVGDAGLYARYFADYPYFVSSRPTEVRYAMLYFRTGSEAEYWRIKKPDVVFGPGRIPDALAAYVAANRFVERAPGVWIRPEGCAGGP